ncbi:hypothetical protein PV11_08322 [Exophiala sideris]|uniref:Uncharacterized protein n=1 Tax=Exophiala sideris TaxID=1016849 RepID=A0A0D1X051_9EURO|nr:hypothetical protein PV11_08322 [Exophiala sideris]
MSSREEIQRKLALLEFEKRRLQIEREEFELKQHLAALDKEEPPESVTIDLTEDQSEGILKQESEKDNGQTAVQDTVEPPLPSDNISDQTAVSIVKEEDENQSLTNMVEKEVAMADVEQEPQAFREVQQGYMETARDKTSIVARRETSVLTNPDDQLVGGEDIRGARGQSTTGARQLADEEHDSEELEEDLPYLPRKQDKPKKARRLGFPRVLERPRRKFGSKTATLDQRRGLAYYYRTLLARHLDSLPVHGVESTSGVRLGLRYTKRCHPQDVNRQIRDFMATKEKPDDFDKIMDRFTFSSKFWRPRCLDLRARGPQTAMIKRVVGQIIAGTFNPRDKYSW